MKYFSSLLLLCLLLTGCSNEQPVNNKPNKLTIYTSVFALEDFTKKIAGNYAEVRNLLPPGADAHSYEFSTKDMKDMADADAFIYVADGLEGMIDKTINTLNKEHVTFIKAGEGVTLLDTEDEHENEEHDVEHGDKDTHVWLDPILSMKLAENIKNGLSQLKPEYKDEFEKNFASLKEQLTKLDTDFQTTLSKLPHHEILVAHAAYGYWHKYNIEEIAITGLTPSNEPSQKQLGEMVDKTKKDGIHYIFFEKNVKPKIADVVKKETGTEVLYLNNLESISEADNKDGKDYFSLMYDNLKGLEMALK